MSSRRSHQNLNISGFSPILNINSPAAYKSPGKDYGINERIELGKEKILSGFDRWKLAESNGVQCVNVINNLKEKARRAGEAPYPPELETYCKKMEIIKTVFEDVIKSAGEFRKEIFGSINILESMKDNEELKYRLVNVQAFLDALIQLYELSLKLKVFIIENVAHTSTSHDSQILLSSWICELSQGKMFRLITQLKISPPDHQWSVVCCS